MCVASHQQCERQWQWVPDVALFHYRWRWQTWGLRVFFFFVELHPDGFLHLWRLACSFTTRWFIDASSLMSTVCFTALRRTCFHRLALIIAAQLLTHRSPHKSCFVFIYLVMIIASPQRLIWSISSCLHCVLPLQSMDGSCAVGVAGRRRCLTRRFLNPVKLLCVADVSQNIIRFCLNSKFRKITSTAA